MMCLDSDLSKSAVLKMKNFYEDLSSLYSTYDIDIFEDVCRRNALMSHAQEKFFAEEIGKRYPLAYSDGKTGCADIVIPEINKELECKLTSKRKAGGFSLQADSRSLKRKKSLDFLYVLTSYDFKKFAVLYFKGLTSNDFHDVSPGARGKIKMRKYLAMKKCDILMGSVSIQNKIEIEKLKLKIQKIKERGTTHTKKYENLLRSLSYWKNTEDRFSIQLDAL